MSVMTKEILNEENTYTTSDKELAPFLVACSNQGILTYVKSYDIDGIVSAQFFPKDKAVLLVEQFYTRKEPHINAKNIFEAVEYFWRKVAVIKTTKTKGFSK